MKRWNKKINKSQENKKIDTFIDEIISVCKKHNFSISHEDYHGSFEIETYNDNNIKWLKDANDNTHI